MPILRIFAVSVIPLTALGLTNMLIQPQVLESRSVFEEPEAAIVTSRLNRQVLMLAASGQHLAAIERARDVARINPLDPIPQYHLAALHAIRGRREQALKFLREALRLGFRESELLRQNEDFQSLRTDPEFQRIIEATREPWELPADHPSRRKQPGAIRDRIALVTEQNTRWNPQRGVLEIEFEPDTRPATGEVVAGGGAAEEQLRQWFRDGTAAGHQGDLYDNRDRDHSNLSPSKFPQLTRVEYDGTAQKVRADWGVQIYQQFNRPVLGNSSTAQVGSRAWRSNPRLFLYSEMLTRHVYNQYVNNHLYVYPEHNDYDPQFGDVYPANMPYCLISQGSSGSDQPFLDAIALTMASFRPDVKRLLVKNGLLMPTIQMIFRRTNRNIRSDDEYLSGAAHPIVFSGSDVNPVGMIEMAHGMQAGSVPPMVQLQVAEEDRPISGRDYFYPPPGPLLFDSPAAIARIWRTTASVRHMVIDASRSRDLNGKSLGFHWVLLQGDPELVTIEPLGLLQDRARITYRWHPRRALPNKPDMKSSRVDIGVFVHNGEYWSAPAFVSSFTIDSEKRTYDEQGRILSVDYADPEVSRNYVDPFLDVPKSWRDDYHYTSSGQLLGWTRHTKSGAVQDFHHDGSLVISRDSLGRVKESRIVRYDIEGHDNLPGQVIMVESGPVLTWSYRSDEDQLGSAHPGR